jgi:glucose/arabinose dehydrogenase
MDLHVRKWLSCLVLPVQLVLAVTVDAAGDEPPPSPVAVTLELLVDGLTAPIDLKQIDDGSGRFLLLDQSGLIHLLDKNGDRKNEPFLDLREHMLPLEQNFEERGLLGLAIHPRFSENGRIYVTYSAPLRSSAPAGWNYTRRVSEFTASRDDPDRADLQSERILMELDWPSRKHNGGGLAFGPDGFLYIGLGDGGGSHGVGKNILYDAFSVPADNAHWDSLAQDLNSLFGKILRIDIDRGFPGYAIPALNPLSGGTGRPEIYAWGFRNPYRIAFDGSQSGRMFVTAIAETLWEGIYAVDRPGNYGWAIKEGSHCFDRLQPLQPPEQCPQFGDLGEPIADPVIEYTNKKVGLVGASGLGSGIGTAVVGGQVYRGAAIPELSGLLVFADWSADFQQPSGQLFVAARPPGLEEPWPFSRLTKLETRVLSIARDNAGELYVLTSDELGPFGATGKVFRILPADR